MGMEPLLITPIDFGLLQRDLCGTAWAWSLSSSLQLILAFSSVTFAGSAVASFSRSDLSTVLVLSSQWLGVSTDASSVISGWAHSLGKAWCIHCAKSRPCRGTSPSLRLAISWSLSRKALGSCLGAFTVSEDIFMTMFSSFSGAAVGACTLASSWFMRPSHSLRQHTE